MKKIFFIILIASICLTQKVTKIKTSLVQKDIIQTFEGLIEGIEMNLNLTQVIPCIKDSLTIGEDLEHAIADIVKKDEKDVLKGLKEIGEAFVALPNAIKICMGDIHQVTKLVELLKSFKSPTSFAYHVGKDIIVNGAQIFDEIENAIKDFKAKNFKGFGKNIGEALASILIGQEVSKNILINDLFMPRSISPIFQILEGVLKGILSDAKLSNIRNCLKDLSQDAIDIDYAVKDFEKDTVKSVAEGLKMIGEALESLPAAMKNCEEAVADAKNLIKMIEAFKSPISFVFHVGKDLIVNGVQIFEEIEAAVKDYKNKDYLDFGINIGKALDKIFVGNKEF